MARADTPAEVLYNQQSAIVSRCDSRANNNAKNSNDNLLESAQNASPPPPPFATRSNPSACHWDSISKNNAEEENKRKLIRKQRIFSLLWWGATMFILRTECNFVPH